MQVRRIAFIAAALAASACASSAAPTPYPATPSTSATAPATPATVPTAAAPTPTTVPPGVKSWASPAVDPQEQTLICLDPNESGFAPEPIPSSCREIIDSTMSVLGTRGKDVVRIEAGLVCTDPTCSDDVIVGFKDGDLEGASVDWEHPADPWDGRLAVSPLHPVDALAWPWGDAAAFDSPAVSRPALASPASESLAARTPLPFCGVTSLDDITSPANKCFAASVRAGHAAEIVEPAQPGKVQIVVRFTGSGSVIIYEALIPNGMAYMLVIGKGGWVVYTPIPPVGWQ